MTGSGLVLGFDCGGTATRAAIADARGNVLGVGEAGPSNYLVVGPAATRQALWDALRSAAEEAGLDELQFHSAAVAMAGAGTSLDHRALGPLVRELPARRCVVDGDMVGAFYGACPEGVGVVVVAGTGSIVFGMNERGERVRVGGWGYLLGDEGSGYAIGLAALRAVLQAHDGRRRRTRLTSAILSALQLSQPPELVERVYVRNLSRPEIAALAPLVARVAESGDATARAILGQAGGALAQAAIAALRQLKLTGAAVRVAVSGGLFEDGRGVAEPFRASLLRRFPGVEISHPELPPVGGAIVMALREAGYAVDPKVRANLSAAAWWQRRRRMPC